MIRAVIFDMDGVIVDSVPVHFEAARKTFKKYGVDLTHEIYQRVAGTTRDYGWSYLVKLLGVHEDYKKLVEEKNKIYMELIEKEGKAFPGVIGLIRRLRNNYKIAVASSSPMKEVDAVTSELGIKNLFHSILSGDNVKNSKPYPDIYLKTAEILGVRPENCLVIEDSVHGIKAAKSAGMKCVAVTNSFGREKLHEADIVIASLLDFQMGWIE